LVNIQRNEVFAAYLLIPGDKLNEKLKEEWVRESLDPIQEQAEELHLSENFMRKDLNLKLTLCVNDFEKLFKYGVFLTF
jgi:Zn-dependent peptidase ImmA (M78 family)